MAKKFIDDKNIERILAAIDEKYLDKNEYYSILNNTTSPTDEYLQFVRDGDIVYSFNGSRPVQVDIRAFTGRDGVDGKDGKDAVNQVVSFVFCRSKDGIPDPPSGGEFIDTLPDLPLGSDGTCIWKDVPQGEGTTYMSKRMFSSDGNHDSAWSDPVVWQDSADFQVEYSADYTPGTHKDGLPSFNSYYKNYSTIIDVEQRASAAELAWRETCRSNGYGTWSDEVENPKYMATCSLKDGVWSDWSITQIQGENGISQYEYIIYKRSHTKPTETFNNNEGSYNNPHPTFNGNDSLAKSWTESIPEGLGRLWRVSRTYVSAGNNGNWSDIILWEDRPGFQVEYSSDYDPSKGDLPLFDTFYQAADNIEAAEGAWRSKCKNLGFGTWSDSSNNAKYMATCSLKDGSWTAWTVTQIVGESSEHLELTNEFDQIYVNEDNKPIAGQTWSTDLKFFIGTTEHTITSEPTIISSYSGISHSFNRTGNNITGIKFNLTGSAAIDSNTVDINISYNGHTKTLTLKKFKGTDDYDIWASSTYYKVDKTGNTTTPRIEINIAKSKVGQESGVEYLDQVPQGFRLVYKSIIDNKESEICTMSADSAILKFTKNPDQTDACYLNPNYDGIKIELLKDNDLYDFVYIEKLLDGQDGVGVSAEHLELTNEFDQIYVNENNEPIAGQTWSTGLKFFIGTTEHTITSEPTVISSYPNISYSFIKEENKITGINFNLNGSAAIDSNAVNIDISYNGHTKTLTLKKFKGTDDYDIWASSTYYKVDKTGNTTTPRIEINIAKSKVGQESGIEYLYQVPQGFQLVYKSIIDDKESEICTMSADSAILEFTKNPDQSNTCYLNPNYNGIKIELLKDNDLYDFVYIEKLLDGQDGVGVSAEHLELTNEFDQIYVNENNEPIAGQTWSTGLKFFSGTIEQPIIKDSNSKLNVNITIINTEEIKSSYTDIEHEWITDSEGKFITGIKFNLTGSAAIDSDTVDIDISYNGHIKTLTLKKFKGTDDYDIWASSTYYKVDKTGNTTTFKIDTCIVKSEVGKNSGAKYLDKVPNEFKLVYSSVMGDSVVEICTMGAGSIIPKFTNDQTPTNAYYLNPDYDGIKIELLKDNELYDFVYIEKLLDGKDGSAEYLELTNEFDQIYVNENNEPIAGQTWYTGLKYFDANGENNIDPNLSTGGLSFEILDGAGEYELSNQYYYSTDGETIMGVKFSLLENVAVVDSSSIDINIKYKGHTKTLTLKKFVGIDDYDIWASSTYYKVDKDGLTTTQQIEVNIANSKVGQESGVEYLDKVPEGFTLKYHFLGSTKEPLVMGAGDKIPRFTWASNSQDECYLDPTYSGIKIELLKDNDLYDFVYIEKLLDGKDGSSEHLELTNEFDQIYVNEDNKPIAGQTWSTQLMFFDGSTGNLVENAAAVSFSSDDGLEASMRDSIVEIRLASAVTELAQPSARINITYNGHTKTFTLKKFKGTDDYDIWASSTYYKVDKMGNTTTPQIEVNVAKSKVGQESGVEYLDQVPEGFKLVYKSIIDNKESEICTMSADSAILKFTKNPDQTDACYLNPNYDGIKIELLKDSDLYDFIYIEKLLDGQDGAPGGTGPQGESAWHIELVDEMDQVYVDSDGKALEKSTYSIVPELYYGGTKIVGKKFSFKIGNVPPLQERDNYTYEINKDEQVSGDIIIHVYYNYVNDPTNGEIYSAHSKYTIKRLEADYDMDLIVNPTQVVQHADNSYSHEQISIKVSCRNLQNQSRSVIETPSGLKTYGYTVYDGTNEINDKFDINHNGDEHLIILKKGNIIVDQVTVNIVKDGEKGGQGDPGTSSFLSSVYTRSYRKPARPVGGNYKDSVPTGCDPTDVAQGLANVKWTDGILAGDLPLWCSQRTFYSIDNDPSDNVWSEPFLLVDSQYFQVEYAPEGANTSLKNFGPYYVTANGDIKEAETLWRVDHDDWSDTTKNAFWMATCRNVKDSKTNETSWTDWQVTRIAGEKGDPGVAAEWTDYRYHASTSYTDAPGLSNPTNIDGPTGWTKSPNSSPIAPYIWVTTAKKTWDSEKEEEIFKDENGQWSTPYCSNASGKDGISISTVTEYYLATNQSTGVTTESGWGWTESIQTITKDKRYLWNYEKITYDGGKQPTETMPVIIGTYGQGDPGKGIESITEYYALNNDPNTKPTGYGINPTNTWSTTPKVSTPTARYLWNFEVITWTVGDPTYTDPVIIGVHGEKGESGSGLAKVPYYAGVVENKPYEASEYATPYVTDANGDAYVLIVSKANGSEINDETKWAKMDQFSAIFASLALIDNGTLGSAVFYKDFMYSKIGISGNEVITTFAPYDSSGNKKSIDTIITDNNRPSYLVDLATGEGYYASGVIKFNKDSAQLGKFIVDSNGFTYAEQGSWGYESNANNTTATVTSLRSYCPNAKTINVNLKRGTVPYGTYPLEGRINAKKGTTVKFDNVAAQSFVVDDNNVLTYLTEPNGTSDYTVKVINNIKYVNATGVEMNIYDIYMEFYSGEKKQKPEPDYVRVEVKDSLNNTVYYGPVESCTVTNNGKTYDYTISLVIPSEAVKMKIAVFNSDSLDGGKYSDYISITRPKDSFYTIEVQDE